MQQILHSFKSSTAASFASTLKASSSSEGEQQIAASALPSLKTASPKYSAEFVYDFQAENFGADGVNNIRYGRS